MTGMRPAAAVASVSDRIVMGFRSWREQDSAMGAAKKAPSTSLRVRRVIEPSTQTWAPARTASTASGLLRALLGHAVAGSAGCHWGGFLGCLLGALRRHAGEAAGDARARELAQRVLAAPARGRVLGRGQPLRHGHG